MHVMRICHRYHQRNRLLIDNMKYFFDYLEAGTLIATTLPRNQWIVDSHLLIEREAFPAINMRNGEMLVCGGYAPYGNMFPSVPFCEIYSSLHRKWRRAANMNIGRSGLTLTLLSNERYVLTIGSRHPLDGHTAEIYDIDMDIWLFVPSIMNTYLIEHTTTLLQNGQVLIVGGNVPGGSILSTAQLYMSSSQTFVIINNLNAARYGHIAILLNSGLSVLIIGGYASFSSPIPPPEIYMAGSWYDTVGDMIQRRFDCAAVLLVDGNVLVAGGVDSSSTMLSSVEIYKPTTGTFSLVQPMVCPRSHFTLTLLPTGQVLAVGGKSSATDECVRITELYDPITDQWRSTGLLNATRYGHNAVLMNNSVLILGGSVDDDAYQYVCERYNL